MQKCSCKGCGKVISVVDRNRSIVNCVKTFLNENHDRRYHSEYKFEVFGTLGDSRLNIGFRLVCYIKYDKKKIVLIPYNRDKCIIGIDTGSIEVFNGSPITKSEIPESVARDIVWKIARHDIECEKELKKDNVWNDDLSNAKNINTGDPFAYKEIEKYIGYIEGTELHRKFLSMYIEFFKNPEFSYKLKDEFLSNISGYRSFIPILVVDFNKGSIRYYDDFLETDESKMKSIPLRTVIDGNKNSYIKYHIEIPFTMCEPKTKSKLVNSIDRVKYSDVTF